MVGFVSELMLENGLGLKESQGHRWEDKSEGCVIMKQNTVVP